MEEVFYTYARFERGTGSELNLDKCEGLWLDIQQNQGLRDFHRER